MNEYLTLNNGAIVENAHCILSDNRLYVYIEETDDIRKYFDLFVEPENTASILANRYGIEHAYSGFTDLYAISKENGNVNLVLKQTV